MDVDQRPSAEGRTEEEGEGLFWLTTGAEAREAIHLYRGLSLLPTIRGDHRFGQSWWSTPTTATEAKEATNTLLSVCVQHEMDHLQGKLFVDHLSALKTRADPAPDEEVKSSTSERRAKQPPLSPRPGACRSMDECTTGMDDPSAPAWPGCRRWTRLGAHERAAGRRAELRRRGRRKVAAGGSGWSENDLELHSSRGLREISRMMDALTAPLLAPGRTARTGSKS